MQWPKLLQVLRLLWLVLVVQHKRPALLYTANYDDWHREQSFVASIFFWDLMGGYSYQRHLTRCHMIAFSKASKSWCPRITFGLKQQLLSNCHQRIFLDGFHCSTCVVYLFWGSSVIHPWASIYVNPLVNISISRVHPNSFC